MAADPELFKPTPIEGSRYWSPASEPFASGDALLHALDNGWTIDGVIFRQEVWLAAGRRTYVYHLELVRNQERLKMKMVHNPFISRVIYRFNVQVVRLNERKSTARERWHAD